MKIILTRFHCRKNRGSLAIVFAEEIAHLRATKSRAIFPGAVKIARCNRRESRDFGALRVFHVSMFLLLRQFKRKRWQTKGCWRRSWQAKRVLAGVLAQTAVKWKGGADRSAGTI